MHRSIPLSAALAATLAIAGCGLTDPYASQHHPQPARATPSRPVTTATVPNADPAPERGGQIPSAAQAAQNKLAAGAAAATPQQALGKYARLYINWTAGTVAATQDELASISTGQARAQALQAAASYRHDTTLTASRVENTGTVVAITPGQGPETGQWVVVTQETTTGQGDYQGLPATDHVTYAQLQPTTAGWVVSSWTPTS